MASALLVVWKKHRCIDDTIDCSSKPSVCRPPGTGHTIPFVLKLQIHVVGSSFFHSVAAAAYF